MIHYAAIDNSSRWLKLERLRKYILSNFLILQMRKTEPERDNLLAWGHRAASDWVWALLVGTRSATIQTLDGEEVKRGGVGPSRGSEARRGIWGFILTALGKTLKGFLA